ncbi:hypothetical protein CLAFUW4_07161 [Fulvia fulva]|uniref:Uncharacterized protein n=1 Tax=Passalora fulva TaxID=5499 RepID=A0A9Q8LJC9_PASFU|nr:uncharacterized protein CLAFUR5_07295 [Fulvia fulva]KAK4621414.1 hypothetical protein CLAFUR4_07170 [Fulvia fulva]KAK4623339.1 hypothetical protein CLAFUR0_07168 [Fulvia fulva]UJO18560.1 hypothetical protein CLAFUR5_07295 [Fulvia fulva]WPV15886.1 hypothetical protein CLAFUW4_07161 [Fulvia fulva]WPV31624.1 hypothetical protein CLAFUW7_07162 [Fulvia fulva]
MAAIMVTVLSMCLFKGLAFRRFDQKCKQVSIVLHFGTQVRQGPSFESRVDISEYFGSSLTYLGHNKMIIENRTAIPFARMMILTDTRAKLKQY